MTRGSTAITLKTTPLIFFSFLIGELSLPLSFRFNLRIPLDCQVKAISSEEKKKNKAISVCETER
jgi:hypothetical protein